MFLGKSLTTIDAKGRFQFPVKYRDDLDAMCAKQVMVVFDGRGCLEIYPRPVWNKRQALIDALPESAAREKTEFYSNSEPAEVDAGGRLALTPTHREEANLQAGTALLKAAGTHFELWTPSREAAHRAASAALPKSEAYLNMPAAASVRDLQSGFQTTVPDPTQA